MTRTLSYLSVLVFLSSVSSVAAQPVVTTNDGLSIWYDTRPTVQTILSPTQPYTVGTSVEVHVGKVPFSQVSRTDAGNAGGPGDGQTLFVSPRLPNNPAFQPTVNLGLHWTGFNSKPFPVLVDQSRKSIFRYITVQSRGGVDEVIVSLGLRTSITKQGNAGVGNRIERVEVVQSSGFWDSNSEVVSPAVTVESDEFLIDTYASRTPTDDGSGPVYNPTGGLVPSMQPYRVAEIKLTAGVWKKQFLVGNQLSYSMKDQVNEGLVVRADANGIPVTPENPDFGYTVDYVGGGPPGGPGSVFRSGSSLNGNRPEANSGGDGLTIGTTSAQVDARLVIQPKGDFNEDGLVTGGDVSGFNTALSAGSGLRQRERYLGDFNNDGWVTGGDVAFFNIYIGVLAIADCAVPNSCP